MATAAAASWEDLLEGEEIAYAGVEPPARPRRAAAGRPRPARRLRARRERRHLALPAPGRGLGGGARGENVVVTTGTASGKSLAFNLPVLDAIAREPKTRALYLYPTKALAQDQARALARAPAEGAPARDLRRRHAGRAALAVREWANLILTNPDMLHVGILPHHERWGDVLHNLRYVVVDEAHVYRGVFGSHVANVLRRLRRLARVYDAEPQFLLASATIANAGELAEALTGEPATVVERDTRRRPSARSSSGTRRSSTRSSACARARSATRRGCSRSSTRAACARSASRRAARRRSSSTASRSSASDAETARRLAPYRAGYTAEQRREHRAAARRGRAARRHGDRRARARDRHRPARLRDLGRLPGHRRLAPPAVGTRRPARRGLAVLVASEDALDQFFAREPEALLSRRVEAAILDHANPRILDPHVLSAAFEAPLDEDDAETLGPEALERAAVLPELERTPAGFVWKGRDYPAARISLRSGDAEAFTVVDARRARSSASSSASARTRPCTRARSTSTSASSTSSRSSTSTAASRSSSRRASTGTRR